MDPSLWATVFHVGQNSRVTVFPVSVLTKICPDVMTPRPAQEHACSAFCCAASRRSMSSTMPLKVRTRRSWCSCSSARPAPPWSLTWGEVRGEVQGACRACAGRVKGACRVRCLVVDAQAAARPGTAANEQRLVADGYAEDIGAAGLQVADGQVRLESEDVAVGAMVDDKD